MAKSQLDRVRTVYRCSSSIANFRDKLHKRLGLEVWHWWKNRNDRVIFFGLYHWKDYIRFLWHRGPKKVFWCGSDILQLYNANLFWRYSIRSAQATHYCENLVEHQALLGLGIESLIRPMIFDDPNKYQVSYKHSDNPRLFATYHPGREDEYAPIKSPAIDYLNGYSEIQFNEKIKNYQGAIRWNEFDGFAETLAKSVLMGQWPVSVIKYPHIIYYDPGLDVLGVLRTKKQPNYEGREYWLKTFKESLNEIINNWNI